MAAGSRITDKNGTLRINAANNITIATGSTINGLQTNSGAQPFAVIITGDYQRGTGSAGTAGRNIAISGLQRLTLESLTRRGKRGLARGPG
jgi:hypothetical protein